MKFIRSIFILKDNRFYFSLICLLNFSLLYSQPGIISEKSLNPDVPYSVETWTSENGLPQNSILNILQTQNGFLWFSTYNGLLRFDGNKFELFNKTIVPNLPDNVFLDLFEDSHENLWLISNNLKLVKYKNGVFTTYSIDNSNPIKSICENDKHELIVASISGKIFKFSENKFFPYFDAGVYVRKIIYSNNQKLFLATSNGLRVYHNNRLEVIKGLDSMEIFKLKQGFNDDVWIYAKNGLHKVNDKETIKVNLPKDYASVSNEAADFLIDTEGNICMASTKGLLTFSKEGYNYININSGLSSNSICSIYKDKENNIWTGTVNAGLNKLKPKVIQTFSKEDGLAEDVCRPILQLKNQQVLIGHCNKVTLWDNKKFSLFNYELGNCAWSMEELNNGDLLFGSVYGGIGKRSKSGYSKLKLPNELNNIAIYALFQDHDGIIWVGTDKGLYNITNGEFRALQGDKTKGVISFVMQDSKKRIWFCSNKGLGVIENGNVKLYTVDDGLSHNNVRHIYEDKEGIFWIATYGGSITRLKNDKFFSYYNKSTELIDNTTSCILEDDIGNFWISSNRGIYSARRTDLNDFADGKSPFMNIHYYGTEDGMKSTECNGGFQMSGVKLTDGRICFPTSGGLAVIDPQKVLKGYSAPTIVVEKILLDNKIISASDSLKEIARETKKIEFRFTVPYYGDNRNLLFQYKLDGFDNDWSAPENTKSANYVGLPPGTYTFHIRVYGNLNEKTFSFRIPFPFWQTKLFYGLLIVFLFLVSLTFFYLRTKTIRKKDAEKIEINKQYASLELKALQSQMNPHFMFNCLNTIRYFITANDRSSAVKYLGKFSTLIRMFLEHSNSNFIPLSQEIEMIRLYVEMEQLRLDEGFEFTIKIDPHINLDETEIPTMLLQPFVENAIHHGLRKLKVKGVLSLSVIFENDLVKIIIDDNGIGRTKAEERMKTESKSHKSMGMKITRDRIDTINYIKNTDVTAEIIDKFDASQNPQGTKVIIHIPLN